MASAKYRLPVIFGMKYSSLSLDRMVTCLCCSLYHFGFDPRRCEIRRSRRALRAPRLLHRFVVGVAEQRDCAFDDVPAHGAGELMTHDPVAFDGEQRGE